jgi:hypothetical protein
MIEVYVVRETYSVGEHGALSIILSHGGICTFRESYPEQIVLTVEFVKESDADQAIVSLRDSSYHVEGPCEY